MSLESTHGAIERRGFLRSTKASGIVESINDWVTGVSSQGDFYHALECLLRRIDVFRKVMNAASEVS